MSTYGVGAPVGLRHDAKCGVWKLDDPAAAFDNLVGDGEKWGESADRLCARGASPAVTVPSVLRGLTNKPPAKSLPEHEGGEGGYPSRCGRTGPAVRLLVDEASKDVDYSAVDVEL